jgi:hypothetical protein
MTYLLIALYLYTMLGAFMAGSILNDASRDGSSDLARPIDRIGFFAVCVTIGPIIAGYGRLVEALRPMVKRAAARIRDRYTIS